MSNLMISQDVPPCPASVYHVDVYIVSSTPSVRRVSIAREARSTAPKAPRPRSGLGTRRCFFNEECLDSTAGAI